MTTERLLELAREKLPDSMDISANPERLRDDLCALTDCVDMILQALEKEIGGSND